MLHQSTIQYKQTVSTYQYVLSDTDELISDNIIILVLQYVPLTSGRAVVGYGTYFWRLNDGIAYSYLRSAATAIHLTEAQKYELTMRRYKWYGVYTIDKAFEALSLPAMVEKDPSVSLSVILRSFLRRDSVRISDWVEFVDELVHHWHFFRSFRLVDHWQTLRCNKTTRHSWRQQGEQ